MGSDAEALAYEEAVYQSMVLRAEAAEELVEAQKHLVRARDFESKAAKILVRKAIYEEEIARLKARSRLFMRRAEEYERYHKEGRIEEFREKAESRHYKSRTLLAQAKMRERQINAIQDKADKILEAVKEQMKLKREHETEAIRLENEAVNIQRNA